MKSDPQAQQHNSLKQVISQTLYNNDTEYTLTLQRADGTKIDLALIRAHDKEPVQFVIGLIDATGNHLGIVFSLEEAQFLRDHLNNTKTNTLLEA